MSSLTTQLRNRWFNAHRNAIPTDGLGFWASLDGQTPAVAETGQTLSADGTVSYVTENGIPCAKTEYSSNKNALTVGFAKTYTNIPVGNSARTLSGWCKASDSSRRMALLGYGGYNNYSEFFLSFDSGYVYVGIYGETLIYAHSVDNTVWHHVAATYDGTDCKAYIDGVQVGQAKQFVNTPNTAKYASNSYNRIFIQPRATPGNGGCIASVRLYNRALTQAEITALAHEFTPTA